MEALLQLPIITIIFYGSRLHQIPTLPMTHSHFGFLRSIALSVRKWIWYSHPRRWDLIGNASYRRRENHNPLEASQQHFAIERNVSGFDRNFLEFEFMPGLGGSRRGQQCLIFSVGDTNIFHSTCPCTKVQIHRGDQTSLGIGNWIGEGKYILSQFLDSLIFDQGQNQPWD